MFPLQSFCNFSLVLKSVFVSFKVTNGWVSIFSALLYSKKKEKRQSAWSMRGEASQFCSLVCVCHSSCEAGRKLILPPWLRDMLWVRYVLEEPGTQPQQTGLGAGLLLVLTQQGALLCWQLPSLWEGGSGRSCFTLGSSTGNWPCFLQQ